MNQELLVAADTLLPFFEFGAGAGGQGLRIEGAVGVALMMTVLALLPALLILMTSYLRFIVVLNLVRMGLGTQTTPPGSLLAALALLLTGFVMWPVVEEANSTALTPYLNGEITQGEMFEIGIQPFREWMFVHVGDNELAAFMEMARLDVDAIGSLPEDEMLAEIPTVVLLTAFSVSELKVAFLIGFWLLIPFTVIDIIVSKSLVGLGVFMLPPVYVALPIKIIIFVLADGWLLLMKGLSLSFLH